MNRARLQQDASRALLYFSTSSLRRSGCAQWPPRTEAACACPPAFPVPSSKYFHDNAQRWLDAPYNMRRRMLARARVHRRPSVTLRVECKRANEFIVKMCEQIPISLTSIRPPPYKLMSALFNAFFCNIVSIKPFE